MANKSFYKTHPMPSPDMNGDKACEVIVFRMKCNGEQVDKSAKLITHEAKDPLTGRVIVDSATNKPINKCKLELGGQEITVVEEMKVLGFRVASSPHASVFPDKQKQDAHFEQAEK